jgi:hypothetical protein
LGLKFCFSHAWVNIRLKISGKRAQQEAVTACCGEKMLFLMVRGAFFVHTAPRYLRHAAGRVRLPLKHRSDKIVFLQQSRRKPFADSPRAIILKAFVYLYEKFHQADQERRNRNRLGHRIVHFYC